MVQHIWAIYCTSQYLYHWNFRRKAGSSSIPSPRIHIFWLPSIYYITLLVLHDINAKVMKCEGGGCHILLQQFVTLFDNVRRRSFTPPSLCSITTITRGGMNPCVVVYAWIQLYIRKQYMSRQQLVQTYAYHHQDNVVWHAMAYMAYIQNRGWIGFVNAMQYICQVTWAQLSAHTIFIYTYREHKYRHVTVVYKLTTTVMWYRARQPIFLMLS